MTPLSGWTWRRALAMGVAIDLVRGIDGRYRRRALRFLWTWAHGRCRRLQGGGGRGDVVAVVVIPSESC